MKSFIDLDRSFSSQPREIGPQLARIDIGRGKEQLFLDQAPQVLRRLSEDARVESITASNEIEGIRVEPGRAEKLAEGSLRFRNRSEKEFSGYRDALDELVKADSAEPVSIPLILRLHRQIFQYTDARGGYLKSDPNLITSRESGEKKIVFEPPSPEDTPFLLEELVVRYNQAQAENSAHPLVLLGAFVVDFLAIHPVADGNGRLARLLTTRELLLRGYGVARYVSIEQRIWETKNAYYSSLYESQLGWREGDQVVWPFVGYLLTVLAGAYETFESRVTAVRKVTGSKQDQVRSYLLEQAGSDFSLREIEKALTGISRPTIRLVLNELRDRGEIRSDGSGPASRWHRI